MSLARRAYVLLGRLVGPIALLCLKVYTHTTHRPRVRIIVVNEQDEFLLVRGVISHHSQWTLPGGGVNRNEMLADAASRELHEETGILRPSSAFRYIRTIEKHEIDLDFVAPLFMVSVRKDDLPLKPFNPMEIAEVGWFHPDALPQHTARLVFVAADEYKSVKAV